MCGSSSIQKFGSKPANIRWSVVRGDTATLTVNFLENDETTPFSTTGWTYKATAYDPQGNVLDDLQTESEAGFVVITVDSCVTEKWGTGYKNIVAELPFDITVRIETEGDPVIWTPVLGTICVLGDITPGGSL